MSDASPTPTTKDELLQRLKSDRLEWDNLIATVPEETGSEPNLPNGWAVKDLLAHVAAYERWTAAQIQAANEGREPTDMELYGREALPGEAGGWDEDQINAAIYEQHKDLTYAEARAFAGEAFNALVAALEATPDDDLLRPGAQAWLHEGNLLTAVAGQTYDHYAMHDSDLRTVAGRMA